MNRKSFIKTASSATILATLGFNLVSCDDGIPEPTGTFPTKVDLTKSPFDILNTTGNWLLHPSRDILFVSTMNGIHAFSSICTHTGCSRSWSFDQNFTCTCHGSQFSTSGKVAKGPAKHDLVALSVMLDGDWLIIDKQ